MQSIDASSSRIIMHLILLAVVIMLGYAVMITSGHSQDSLLKDHSANNRTVRSLPCAENEYPHNGRCCLKCPPGTHVSWHCTEDHSSGYCSPCTSGKYFTAAPNGMEECIQCHPCRIDDQEQVAECTAIRDYQCRCKPNTFCTDSCLYCRDCTRCPEGQYVKHNCTPTSDTVCEDSRSIHPADKAKREDSQRLDENKQALLIALSIFTCIATCVVIYLVIYWRQRHKGKKINVESGNENYQRPPFQENESAEPEEASAAQKLLHNFGNVLDFGIQDTNTPLGQEDKEDFIPTGKTTIQFGETEPFCEDEAPCGVLTINPTDESLPTVGPCTCGCDNMKSKHNQQLTEQEWLECYNCLKRNVPPSRWNEMMRHLGLSQIDIEIISNDHSDFRESSYQKLRLWRNQNGQSASMWKVLNVLDDMNLRGCKENVANDLMSKGICDPPVTCRTVA